MKELRQIKLALIDSDFMTDRVKNILSTLDEDIGKFRIFKSKINSEDVYYGRNFKDYIELGDFFLVNDIIINLALKLNTNYYNTKNILFWYIERTFKIKISSSEVGHDMTLLYVNDVVEIYKT